MKLNKITVFLSALTLVITAQPAFGMYDSLKKNPYVKYGATALTAFTLGMGLMHYLKSGKQETVNQKPSNTLDPYKLQEIKVIFDVSKTSEKEELISHTFWTQGLNLEVLNLTTNYRVSVADAQLVDIRCDNDLAVVLLWYNQNMQTNPDVFKNPLKWQKILDKTYEAVSKKSNEIVLINKEQR